MKAPLTIVDYSPTWPRQFAQERARLLAAVGRHVVGIEHVGSTAVPGLGAKPVLDMLMGVHRLEDARPCFEPLWALGYEYVPEYEAELPDRRYFRKGPPEARTHHLHLVAWGGDFWVRHLLFRDYLRAQPETAQVYEALKRDLAARYAMNHAEYTAAKGDFIRGIEAAASWAARAHPR